MNRWFAIQFYGPRRGGNEFELLNFQFYVHPVPVAITGRGPALYLSASLLNAGFELEIGVP